LGIEKKEGGIPWPLVSLFWVGKEKISVVIERGGGVCLGKKGTLSDHCRGEGRYIFAEGKKKPCPFKKKEEWAFSSEGRGWKKTDSTTSEKEKKEVWRIYLW